MPRTTRRIRASAAVALAAGLFLSACGGSPRAAAPVNPTGAPPEAPAPRFREVGLSAGLRVTPDQGLLPPLDILQTAGYGGGFLDYDGDGVLDVLLVGRPRCALFRGDGHGRFQNVTRAAGLDLPGHWMGCATGDWDNDGRVDLFLSGYRLAALLRNTGGRFTRVPLAFPAGDWGTSAAFLDYDLDGRLDLYVGCYVRFGPGAPRLCDYVGVKAACSPSHYDAQAGHLYRNLGHGRFADVTAGAGLADTHGKTLGVAVCDYDADGRPDLYLANDGMPCDLYHNEGGRFRNVGLESGTAFNGEGAEQAGMGVDWGDVDGDGRPDLVVTTFQHEPTSLYLAIQGGVFREEAYARGLGDRSIERLGFGARFLDADNDGWPDLFVANGHVQDAIAKMQPGVTYAQPPQLFHNRAGRFVEVGAESDWARPIVGRAVACGDYDRDGRVDLLVTDLHGRPLLLHNETATAAAWLSIRLEGTRAPRDGTGAVVEAGVGGRTLWRRAGTDGGYLSASEGRVHFGLGSAARPDSLRVRWPGGTVQELSPPTGCPLGEGRWTVRQGQPQLTPD